MGVSSEGKLKEGPPDFRLAFSYEDEWGEWIQGCEKNPQPGHNNEHGIRPIS